MADEIIKRDVNREPVMAALNSNDEVQNLRVDDQDRLQVVGNTSSSEIAFSSQSASLADGASLDSGWLDLSSVGSYQLSIFADAAGLSLIIDSSETEGGGGIDDTTSTTALLASFLSTLPAREKYMRFRVTNNSGSAITNVKFEVKFTSGVGTGASVFPAYVAPAQFSPAILTQSISIGQDPGGGISSGATESSRCITRV